MIETLLAGCRLCARSCGADRLDGDTGFCQAGRNVKIARAALHFWEEPCISGRRGSGTVFFAHCNLRCVFCQNHPASQQGVGREISIDRLSEIFLELMAAGAHNINLVTPTHYAPHIMQALNIARRNGLSLPVVYNTNSYENVETIRFLKGSIDVYLPDLKYYNDKYALKYSGVDGYFAKAKVVIEKMVDQVGAIKFNREGLLVKGVLVRHLALPGLLFDSKKVIDYLYRTFGDSIYISLMNQYTPLNQACKYPEINKPLHPGHYRGLIEYCQRKGMRNVFIQKSGTASPDFVPPFDLEGV
ncbi:Radical SAM superfamily protein [Pelotomaculum sp. FP]|uniref:radical SAM protein n=1 Tax=Pelotomaculum sp. FP TaxID=261474 RepID=UPI001066E8EB|nr:radical SAM protein [Pelotomaculum sp. FP]TEB10426.1 Radical SAM superfamily protein [Pelotomaculum sp. FP]